MCVSSKAKYFVIKSGKTLWRVRRVFFLPNLEGITKDSKREILKDGICGISGF
jgi:hypothetical protein